jgi:hypothetical protein
MWREVSSKPTLWSESCRGRSESSAAGGAIRNGWGSSAQSGVSHRKHGPGTTATALLTTRISTTSSACSVRAPVSISTVTTANTLIADLNRFLCGTLISLKLRMRTVVAEFHNPAAVPKVEPHLMERSGCAHGCNIDRLLHLLVSYRDQENNECIELGKKRIKI